MTDSHPSPWHASQAYTVKPCLIQTPHYYRQFVLSLGKETLRFSLNSTHFIQMLCLAPSVSVLMDTDCISITKCMTSPATGVEITYYNLLNFWGLLENLFSSKMMMIINNNAIYTLLIAFDVRRTQDIILGFLWYSFHRTSAFLAPSWKIYLMGTKMLNTINFSYGFNNGCMAQWIMRCPNMSKFSHSTPAGWDFFFFLSRFVLFPF